MIVVRGGRKRQDAAVASECWGMDVRCVARERHDRKAARVTRGAAGEPETVEYTA
ncbi:hypothetical protein [Lentzea sp. HUAS12]|uniref:hypothetical protein n=1 Tax=Lentzea sp. HUAS12 TaxID=2951806 RepID=UPI00209F3596|nr:hypothetical protein [Lentzea sp. HUAS12]USX55833.1 hypothetical protein ND450_17565 [Lentzea sp. HUAS12]